MTRLSLSRIWSQAYRSFIIMRAESFRLLDVSIWPFVLLLSTALFANYVTDDARILGMIVLGALGWRVLYHFQMEPVQGIMDEYWHNSLEHLFVTPIRVAEVLMGGLLSSVFKAGIVAAMFLAMGRVFFGFTVPDWGLFLAGVLAAVVCGIIMALISLGVAFLKGSDSYAFLYALADVMAVLSGVFYPLAVFPKAVQTAVQVLPTTHAFDLLKAVVGMAEPHPVRFLAVAGVWLILAIWFNRWAFQKARKEGRLVRMK